MAWTTLPSSLVDASLWASAPPAGMTARAAGAVRQQTVQVDLDLVVTARVVETDVAAGTTTFRDGVVATYGVTTLEADRMVLNTSAGTGVAEGRVKVRDPEGTLEAANLQFDWKAKTGVAENVQLVAGGLSIQARRVEIKDGAWVAEDAFATPCRRSIPSFGVRTGRVEIRPGREARVRRPKLVIFGRQVVGLPTQSYNLNPRSRGIGAPSLSLRNGNRLGATWNPQVMLNGKTTLGASWSSIPGSYPGYGLALGQDLLPSGLDEASPMPQSELNERFSDSFMDRVTVPSPQRSYLTAARPRRSWQLSTSWNERADVRLGEERFSKALELAVAAGGPAGPVAWVNQLRLQSIRRSDEPFVTRAVAESAATLRPVTLARGIYGIGRLDGTAYLGEGHLFAWGRAMGGLSLEPSPAIRLSAAYVIGRETGDPQFLADRLYAREGWHLRGDLNLGPTKFSLLYKYDRGRSRWYSREYTLSQVVGCIEPYVIYRQLPSTYSIGVRLRIDDFVGAIRRRSPARGAEVAKD